MIKNKSKSVLKSACTHIYWYFRLRRFKPIGHKNKMSYDWAFMQAASEHLKEFYKKLNTLGVK
jgi:hypothetical protein